jgi:hypothetical protein
MSPPSPNRWGPWTETRGFVSLKSEILIEGLWLGSIFVSEREGTNVDRRKFCVKWLRDLYPAMDTNCDVTDGVIFSIPLLMSPTA